MPVPGSEPTFRHCLLLSVPALLIGFYIRFELLRAIPWAYFGADSGSYSHTMQKFWLEGWGLSIPEKRRWLYPLILLPLPASPFSVLATLAFLQHFLGLASAVALAWIVAHVTRFWRIWIPVATCLYVVWPRILWYEHEAIAEGVFLPLFLLATALAFPLSRLVDKKSIFYFLLAIGSLALLKPHGKVLWVVMLAVLVLINRRPLQWGLRNWLTIAATGLLIATSGSASQGSWLLLSSALPLVSLQGSHQEYRTLLAPLLEEVHADEPNYIFTQSDYKRMLNSTDKQKRLGEEWAKLVKDERRFKQVSATLAFDAILHSPLDYSRLVGGKMLVAGSDYKPNSKLEPAVYFQEQFQVKHFVRNPEIVPLLFDTTADELPNLAKDVSERNFGPYAFLGGVASFFSWSTAVQAEPGHRPELGLRWTGWLLLAGFLLCLTPSRFRLLLMVWAPSLTYLLVCFGVGDAVRRYLQPVEWAGLVLVLIALDGLLRLADALIRILKLRGTVGNDTLSQHV